MKSVFIPAVKIMGAMRYPVKFTVIFLLVLIPLSFLGYNMVHTLEEEIVFLEGERTGLEYVKDVRFPIQHIQQHRGMTAAYLTGATEFKDRIMKKRQDVDNYLAMLAETDARLGAQLDTNGLLQPVMKQWQHIKANSLNQSLAQAIKSHTGLIADLLHLKVRVADSSGITLDPKLDSYYLGDTLVATMPQLLESMGQARAVGSSVAGQGQFTKSSSIKLAVLVNNIETYAKKLSSGLQTAIDENESIKKNLESAIAENNQAISKIEHLLKDELLNADVISISGGEVFKTATEAIDGSYELYDALVPELDAIWGKRIQDDLILEYIEVSVIAIVLLLLSYLFAGLYFSIKESIELVGQASRGLAEGNLTTRLSLNTKDEMQDIASNFNQMATRFESAIQQIMTASSQLAAASEEVSSIAQESAGNLANQRSETEQVATAMNEMAATVQEVAHNASDAAGAAKNADKESHSGKAIVSQASESIDKLATEVERSADVIDTLAKDSDDIGSVLDVIKGIAEQTNLLALNAAIEAARAGEQGRGFAVVADEVRTLAGRTQESTEEIEGMIDKLQSGARNAVTAMQAGQEQAKIGVEHTAQAGIALDAITEAVAVIDRMNTQIASAAEQQSSTADDMNQNIVNISRLADQTAESAQQSTTSSEELSSLALDLQNLVGKFKVS
jgi:methyl-accepting chemotaxis protein